jgi:predicted ArsR family transcriptional regulator
MFLPIFHDLIKPQWRAVLEELKRSGSLPVSVLTQQLGVSYMAAKQHCEDLKKIGYLERTRIPRSSVGRPEIFYSLSAKADALFPQAGVDFTLDLLEEIKSLHGDSTPDRILFQHFQKQQEKWTVHLTKLPTLVEKIKKLAALREQNGCSTRCTPMGNGRISLEEFHNPLQRIFEHYPRAVTMEQRMIEELLGTRVTRQELDSGRQGQPRVIFEVSL